MGLYEYLRVCVCTQRTRVLKQLEKFLASFSQAPTSVFHAKYFSHVVEVALQLVVCV